MTRVRVIAGVVLLLLAGTVVLVSLTFDAPAILPAVALESKELLFVEQVAAFFVAGLLGFVILAHALEGRLPSELRGVKWQEIEKAKDESQVAIDALTDEVQELRSTVDRLEQMLGVR